MKKKNSLETMKKKLSLKKKSISIFDKKMRKETKGGAEAITPIVVTLYSRLLCKEKD